MQTRSRLRLEKLFFSLLRVAAVAVILMLVGILFFIFYRGFISDKEVRSRFLSYNETSPHEIAIVVNKDNDIPVLDFTTLKGLYTDAYLNWAKISTADFEVMPLILPENSEGGKLARELLFGPNDVILGNVTEKATSEELITEVANNKGAIALLPASDQALITKNPAVTIVKLRRLVVRVNESVLAIIDNKAIEDISDAQLHLLLAGTITNWKELGGPDQAPHFIAAPAQSELATILSKSAYKDALAKNVNTVTSDTNKGNTETKVISETKVTDDTNESNTETKVTSVSDELAATEGAFSVSLANEISDDYIDNVLTIKSHERSYNLPLSFLYTAPRLSGAVGGISTIIANTLFLLVLTLLWALPVGIGAAIYFVEYSRGGTSLRILRLGTETLAGIPSIIFGLFGMLFFVNTLHFGFGLLSGSLSLALMILPTIVRTSEEALKAVPRSLREASLALGAGKFVTVYKVILRSALAGITAGVLLAIGRALGETAVLLFTMGSDYKMAQGLFSSARSLSTHIYLLFSEGISFDRAFASASILILIIILINFLTKRIIARRP